MTNKDDVFDFTISCAEPEIGIGGKLYDALLKKRFKVFFYKDHKYKSDMLGKDRTIYFRSVVEKSRYCIVLISKVYDEQPSTKIEREIIQARALKSSDAILLPVLIDGYNPDWLPSGRMHWDLRKDSLKELVKILEQKARTPKSEVIENSMEIIEKKPANCDDYNWEELLHHIKNRNVIPVIGHGLYFIKRKVNGKPLLYDFLAQQILPKSKRNSSPNTGYTFSDACAEYLEKNQDGYKQLEKVLNKNLAKVRMPPNNSLWRLANTQHFNIFITTAYDDLLADSIKQSRGREVTSLSYTINEKRFDLLDDELFDNIKNSRRSLVYHILGIPGKNLTPAYSNKDIHEAIQEFLNDMKEYDRNRLFRELRNKCLLFLGFRDEDLLLPSFIPGYANLLSRAGIDSSRRLYIGGISGLDGNPHNSQSLSLLKGFKVEDFSSLESEDFIECLLKKLEKD